MMAAPADPPAIVQTIDLGCGSGAEQAAPSDPADPWEGANRRLYAVNEGLDKVAIRPLSMTYRRVLPRPARNAVHHALENLDEPRLAIDHLLQGKIQRAGGSVVRFATNSTIGVLGIFDVAKRAGFERHDTDFGIILGRHHVAAGPYIYVPVLGPSTVRDLIGTGVDFGLDPLNWVQFRGSTAVSNTTLALEGLDTRASIDRDLASLKRTAVDPYATIRSIYTQLRESEVRGGAMDVMNLPEFPSEPELPVEDQPPSSH